MRRSVGLQKVDKEVKKVQMVCQRVFFKNRSKRIVRNPNIKIACHILTVFINIVFIGSIFIGHPVTDVFSGARFESGD